MTPDSDSFPRQSARTRGFTLGAPRSFQMAQDGSRVVFLRSRAGDDPLTALWAFDVESGRERLIADPSDLTSGLQADALSLEERARRERVREKAGGIVSFAIDGEARLAAFVHAGQLFIADLLDGGVRRLDVPAPVFDPRPDPTGSHVAFVHDRALHIVRLSDGVLTTLAGEQEPTISWGMAEFIAAEEMERSRGYWWAPDGSGLLATRVDEAPVRQWWIADAAQPTAEPRSVRYPAAGTANAIVGASILRLDGSGPVEVAWDRRACPYLTAATWDEHGPMLAVQSRDQRSLTILAIDAGTGAATALSEQSDAEWVDIVGGVPSRLADGRLVTVAPSADALALHVGGAPVTPADLEVRSVLAVTGEEVLFSGGVEPTEIHIYQWDAGGTVTAITDAPGVHTAVSAGGRVLIGSAGMDHDGTRWMLGGHRFASHAQAPILTPSVELMRVGERELRVGLVLPREHDGHARLPVLMDPYGGPHAQRVMATRGPWREPQWFADQGFAVIVADGRGTPGRGISWARAVHGDLAAPVLEDQLAALDAVAARRSDLDLSRVAIRGWSFGGYLAALAVLRRPDRFHAAVAGAPVTEWRLYDTHYTERYLGTDPEGADGPAYDRSSLLSGAASLQRPLLIIHGLADDNVFAAHTLQFSQRLTESGRLHGVLPLSGITHMTPQEAVAENLLNIEIDFLRRSLGILTTDADRDSAIETRSV